MEKTKEPITGYFGRMLGNNMLGGSVALSLLTAGTVKFLQLGHADEAEMLSKEIVALQTAKDSSGTDTNGMEVTYNVRQVYDFQKNTAVSDTFNHSEKLVTYSEQIAAKNDEINSLSDGLAFASFFGVMAIGLCARAISRNSAKFALPFAKLVACFDETKKSVVESLQKQISSHKEMIREVKTGDYKHQ